MNEFDKALAAYAKAVAKRAFWEDHGNRGDGHLESARIVERAAKAEVKRAAKALALVGA